MAKYLLNKRKKNNFFNILNYSILIIELELKTDKKKQTSFRFFLELLFCKRQATKNWTEQNILSN